MTLGERLRQLRFERGWTQLQLAAECWDSGGMWVQMGNISGMERDRIRYPTLRTLAALAAGFEMSVSELLESVEV